MTLRLGFYYHVPAMRDVEGGIAMPGYLGRFVDSLAEFCEEVVCFQHLPGPGAVAEMDHRIKSGNVRLVPLGQKSSVPVRFVRASYFVEPIRRSAGEIEVLLARGPSPLLPAAIAAAQPKTRTALLLVGDYLKGIADLAQPRWRKSLIKLWSKWNKRGQDKAATSSLTFVNSQMLYEEYSRKALQVAMTRTTTLRSRDIWVREGSDLREPFRMLYVGRVETSKGILDIAEALRILVVSGCDAVLDLVGAVEQGDPVFGDLDQFCKIHGLMDRVHQHGYKALGPELFQYYRRAGVCVIATRGSEGFPRTIWEAMANGTPVVATRVGSIPRILEDRVSALLVEPNSPGEIANSVKSLAQDPLLRSRLVEHGYSLARRSTLEQSTQSMISQLEAFVSA